MLQVEQSCQDRAQAVQAWLMGGATHTGSVEKNIISPSAFAAIENRSSKDKPVPSAVTAVMELCYLQVLRSWQ